MGPGDRAGSKAGLDGVSGLEYTLAMQYSSLAFAAVGALLGAGLLYTVSTVNALEARIAELESRPAMSAAGEARGPNTRHFGARGARLPAERPERAKPLASSASERSGPARSVDLKDPELRGELAQLVEETSERRWEQRREEWTQRWMDDMRDEVAMLAEDYGWDEQTASRVRSELEELHAQSQAVREDAWQGGLSRFQARDEVRALREQSSQRLSDLLSPEAFEAVEERFLSRGGGRM